MQCQLFASEQACWFCALVVFRVLADATSASQLESRPAPVQPGFEIVGCLTVLAGMTEAIDVSLLLEALRTAVL